MPVLESERLVIRPPRPSDIAAMTVWLGDYEVSRNLARVPHPYGEADAEDFVALRAVRPEDPNDHRFTIARKADGLFLGGIGLHPADKGLEMGYWLGKPFWRSGYASEAARRVARFAFEGLGAQEVWAGWFHDNPASGHVLAKLGARHSGSVLRHSRARGVAVLCHEMRLTRADFLRKEAA